MGGVVIGVEGAADEPAMAVRAHRVDRSHSAEAVRQARARTGEKLRAALAATSCAIVEVARAWSVDPRLVANVLDGIAPLTWERIVALPARVQERFLDERLLEIRAEREARAFIPPPPASAARRVTAAQGALDGMLDDALADGVVDESERRTLVPLAAKVVERAALQLRAIERVK